MSLSTVSIRYFVHGNFWHLIIGLTLGIVVYAISLLLMKDKLFIEILTSLKTTISNGRKI